MSDLNHLPPTVGAAKPAQKAAKIYEITAADRLLLGGTLLWCFLAVDTFLFAPVWGIGLTAAVVLWYFLLLAALGRKALFRRESAILLAVNLFLAAFSPIPGSVDGTFWRCWSWYRCTPAVSPPPCSSPGGGPGCSGSGRRVSFPDCSPR